MKSNPQNLQLIGGVQDAFLDFKKNKSEDTLIFAEMMTRLLAQVNVEFTQAGVTITDEDAAMLEAHINKQLEDYTIKGTAIELIDGLKATAVRIATDGKDLTIKFVVEREASLYRGVVGDHYVGHHNGEDLWYHEQSGKLTIRNSQNPKHDLVVDAATSSFSGAVEARKRMETILWN